MVLESDVGKRVYIHEDFFSSLPATARRGKLISCMGMLATVLWDDNVERKINTFYLELEK